jgi:hypothetical protein
MNDSYLKYFQAIYKKLHDSTVQYLVIPNVDQMVTTVYDPVWLDGDSTMKTIDGAMMENFGGYKAQDMWQTLERGLKHITSKGKILIAQFYDNSPAERMRRTAMYMLIKNENSYLNILKTGNVEWYPEYEIDLGNQSKLPDSLEKMRVKGADWHSLWRRDYDSGMVLVNTSDAEIKYNPYADNWAKIETSGGGEINDDGTIQAQEIKIIPFSGEITIPASDCVILKKLVKSNVEDNSKQSDFDISPNPASDKLYINYSENLQFNQIEIFNILGSKVLSVPSDVTSDRTKQINIGTLASGVYFIKVSEKVKIFVKE